MDLVHDVHPLADGGGRIDRLVPKSTDLVYAVIGGGVQLQHIHHRAVLNAPAGRTLVAGIAVHRMLAVHCPGQNFGAGGLAGAPGAGKQVGVRKTPVLNLTLEGIGDMALAHHIVKGAGSPLSVKGLIHCNHLFK